MRINFTILLSTVVFYQTSSAQITRNAVLLSGQLSYSGHSFNQNPGSADLHEHSATVLFSAGKAFRDNQVWGVSFMLSPSSNYQYSGVTYQKYRQQFNSAGLYYQRFRKLGRDFNFFWEGQLSVYQHTGKYTDLNNVLQNKTKTNGIQAGFAPGITYKLSQKLLLISSLPSLIVLQQYSTTHTGYSGETRDDKGFTVFSGIKNLGSLSNASLGMVLVL